MRRLDARTLSVNISIMPSSSQASSKNTLFSKSLFVKSWFFEFCCHLLRYREILLFKSFLFWEFETFDALVLIVLVDIDRFLEDWGSFLDWVKISIWALLYLINSMTSIKFWKTLKFPFKFLYSKLESSSKNLLFWTFSFNLMIRLNMFRKRIPSTVIWWISSLNFA